jgi:hypothetical protein
MSKPSKNKSLGKIVVKSKCKCQKDMVPEVIPGISIGFRHKEGTTLCYFQIKNKLRVGATICGNDEFSPLKGEKVAFRRAMGQHKLGRLVRTALWAQFLLSRGQEVDNSARATLTWFKSGKVIFNV